MYEKGSFVGGEEEIVPGVRRAMQKLAAHDDQYADLDQNWDGEAEKRQDEEEEGRELGSKVSIGNIITEEMWSEKESVVEAALKKLVSLCQHDKSSNKAGKEIYKAGGHVSIIGCMKKFSGSERIQKQGLRALMNTSFKNDEMQLVIGNLGGVAKVVGTLQEFAESEEIQRIGCGCINNLIRTEKNAERFVRHDGIPTLIAAMENFPENTDLQLYALLALKVLFNLNWKVRVKAAGAEPVVADAFSRHYKNEKVRDSARAVLKLMVS